MALIQPETVSPQNLEKGVADGIRPRDRRHHKPELYQLSYCHLAGGNLPGQGRGHLAAHQLDRVEVAVEEVLAHDAAEAGLLQSL